MRGALKAEQVLVYLCYQPAPPGMLGLIATVGEGDWGRAEIPHPVLE